MRPEEPPPFVPVGPWRREEANLSPAPPPKKERGWFSHPGNWFFHLFDLVDLGEILFGFLRVVAHLVVVALHAIFHI